MRILHLISSNGFFGAERVIIQIAQNCSEQNVIVGALLNEHNPHLEIIEEARRKGIKTAAFKSAGRFDFRTVSLLKNFIRENRIEILHTHNYKSDVLGFLATRMVPVKWVATNHVWHGTDQKLRIYEALDAILLGWADMVTVVSEPIQQDLLRKKIPAKKIKFIPNGIEVSEFERGSGGAKVRHEFGFEKDAVIIGTVGRLSLEKRQSFVIEAAIEIIKRKKEARFLIVGDGPLRPSLEQKVQSQNLADKIIFTGIRRDMRDVYSALDILVHTSAIEGLPMILLEAMAAKVAVIISAVGDISKVIRHQENGILLKEPKVSSVLQALDDLIDDPKQRNLLTQQAYADVTENFTAQRMAAEYIKLYESVMLSNKRE